VKRPLFPVFRSTLLAAALVLPLTAAGCGDKGNAEAGTQKAGAANSAGGPNAASAPAAGAAATSLSAQDTSTRTVGSVLKLPTAADSAKADSIAKADSVKQHYNSGEDPRFAAQMGWPVNGPKPLPGAILPQHRIVAYYGNPLSKRMGVLGEYEKSEMLRRLDGEVAAWNRADPAHPVMPALHLIVSVAQGEPGRNGKYRIIMRDSMINEVHSWARSRNGVFFIDIQTGWSTIQEMLPSFETFLKQPDVHLAVDPEFMMVAARVRPGAKIGQMSVADINWVTGQVARIVRENHLPPKVVVIHRFTRNMIQGNTRDIVLRPEVQLVINMDGWGAPWLKRDSYRDYVVRHPVEYTGFKIFYHNDQKKAGSRLMTKQEVLALHPTPLYIQYQ
jgi:hypothetical protein